MTTTDPEARHVKDAASRSDSEQIIQALEAGKNKRVRKLLGRMTMKQLEARLDPDRFLRVHRSAIVNVDEIAAALRDRHGLYAVELTNGARVRVGRKYRDGLSELIQQTQARPRAEDAAA